VPFSRCGIKTSATCKTADTYEEFIVRIFFFDIFFQFKYLKTEEIEASLYIN